MVKQLSRVDANLYIREESVYFIAHCLHKCVYITACIKGVWGKMLFSVILNLQLFSFSDIFMELLF